MGLKLFSAEYLGLRVGIAIPELFFSIPGFGIDASGIPGSRDPGIPEVSILLWTTHALSATQPLTLQHSSDSSRLTILT